MSLTRRLIAEVSGEETIAQWKREIQTPELREPVAKTSPEEDEEIKRHRLQKAALKRAERADSGVFQSRFQDRWKGYWGHWNKLVKALVGQPGSDQPQHMWGRGR